MLTLPLKIYGLCNEVTLHTELLQNLAVGETDDAKNTFLGKKSEKSCRRYLSPSVCYIVSCLILKSEVLIEWSILK